MVLQQKYGWFKKYSELRFKKKKVFWFPLGLKWLMASDMM